MICNKLHLAFSYKDQQMLNPKQVDLEKTSLREDRIEIRISLKYRFKSVTEISRSFSSNCQCIAQNCLSGAMRWCVACSDTDKETSDP